MLCPKCQRLNLAGATNCANCNTPLLQPAISGDSPFEGFLPAWMQPGAVNSMPVANPSSNGYAKSAAPSDALGFSIDDLLKATEATTAGNRGSVAGNAVAPDFPSNTDYRPPITAVPTRPMPSFEEPPLWGKPAQHAAFDFREQAPRPSSSAFDNAEPVRTAAPTPPDHAEPAYGLDRGFYYYTDQDGELIVAQLAGFGSRVWGAVADAVLLAIITAILYFTVGIVLVASFVSNASQNPARFRNRVAVESELTQEAIAVALILSLMGTLIPFLYHVVLLGLGGQTLGHRLAKIKVIRSRGRSVGIMGAVIRTLYGVIPGLWSIVLSVVMPNTTGSILTLAVYLLVGLGLLLPLFDKGKQGLHDKLADTYVITTQI